MYHILDVGGGDGSFARLKYPDAKMRVTLDLKTGYDVMKMGLPEGPWDVILMNHFIEHVLDPDYLLDLCKKAMDEFTILEIGIPNLCAWFNRIFFLFGYLPHSYELSYRYNLGKPFDWNNEELGGHIRVFNLPSMLQLLKNHGFEIIEVRGEASLFPTNFLVRGIDKFLTWLNPNLASSVRIICRKKFL